MGKWIPVLINGGFNMYKFKQSKENARWLRLYENSEIYSLGQIYNSYSYHKHRVYENIRNSYINYDATDMLKILTYTKTIFTARLYV